MKDLSPLHTGHSALHNCHLLSDSQRRLEVGSVVKAMIYRLVVVDFAFHCLRSTWLLHNMAIEPMCNINSRVPSPPRHCFSSAPPLFSRDKM
mmetsp:Transcript_21399/g.49065  ORF Transcript_21399/g.49065 Transcript_21399/m.49065 type:complete len:92 (-) Transcript_21399:33-308(-)